MGAVFTALDGFERARRCQVMPDKDALNRLLEELGQKVKGAVTGSHVAGHQGCEVHGVDLQKDTLRHTICVFSKEYREAGRTLFPYANPNVLRECLGGGMVKEAAETLFCPACREAEAVWLRENG